LVFACLASVFAHALDRREQAFVCELAAAASWLAVAGLVLAEAVLALRQSPNHAALVIEHELKTGKDMRESISKSFDDIYDEAMGAAGRRYR